MVKAAGKARGPFCAICGAANHADARFCRSCGEGLDQALPVAAPVAAPASRVLLVAVSVIVLAAATAAAVVVLARDDGTDSTDVTSSGPGGPEEAEPAAPEPGGFADLAPTNAEVHVDHLVSLPTGPDSQFDGANTVGAVDDSTLLALGILGGGDIAHTAMWRSMDRGRTWSTATPPSEGYATALVGGDEDGEAVAVGYQILYDGELGRAGQPLAWTTADAGGQWAMHEIEGTDSTFRPRGVATDGEGTLVAGGYDGPELRDEGPSDPVIVVSADGGENWEPVAIEADPLQYDGITSVAYGNGRFVASGYIDTPVGEYEYDRETVVWVSEDGREWERSPVDDFGVSYGDNVGLIGLGDGIAAVFDRHDIAVTDNGVDWRLVPLTGLDYGEDTYGEYGDIPYGGVRIGDELVLVGDESYEDGSGPRAWVADLTG